MASSVVRVLSGGALQIVSCSATSSKSGDAARHCIAALSSAVESSCATVAPLILGCTSTRKELSRLVSHAEHQGHVQPAIGRYDKLDTIVACVAPTAFPPGVHGCSVAAILGPALRFYPFKIKSDTMPQIPNLVDLAKEGNCDALVFAEHNFEFHDFQSRLGGLFPHGSMLGVTARGRAEESASVFTKNKYDIPECFSKDIAATGVLFENPPFELLSTLSELLTCSAPIGIPHRHWAAGHVASADARGQVHAANMKFYQAFESGKSVLMQDVWDEEGAICHDPDEATNITQGKSEVIISFESIFQSRGGGLKFNLVDENLVFRDNVGYVTQIEELLDVPSNVRISSINAFVKHTEEGEWKMAYHKASPVS